VRTFVPSVLALLLIGGCRLHTLEDGAYSVARSEILRDDCGLSNQPDVFGRATLLKAGHGVRLDYSYLNAQLTGTYRYGLEEFTADGTVGNARLTLRGQDCQVDFVQLGLDAVTQTAQRFTGTLTINAQSRAADACTCRFIARYDASRAGGP
jgi:hypothetical protein